MARVSVVLLRGVNVNGITVRSADLRACLLAVDGIEEVRTVLASGNAVVRTGMPLPRLKADVEQALRDRFGYDAWTVVLDADELRAIAGACELPDDDPDTHAYVTFASAPDALTQALDDVAGLPGADRVRRLGDAAVEWPAAKGTSTQGPVAKVFAKARYKASTTTRNARTIAKILTTADALGGS